MCIRDRIIGVVKEIAESASLSVIYVDIGTLLLVEITTRSLAELGLTPGLEVHLIIKANSIGVAEIN